MCMMLWCKAVQGKGRKRRGLRVREERSAVEHDAHQISCLVATRITYTQERERQRLSPAVQTIHAPCVGKAPPKHDHAHNKPVFLHLLLNQLLLLLWPEDPWCWTHRPHASWHRPARSTRRPHRLLASSAANSFVHCCSIFQQAIYLI